MAQRLEDLVQFNKSLYKLVKSQLKDLGKSAKKARKKEERELPADEARERLDETLTLLAKGVDTTAMLADGDANTRIDLVVDGHTLIEDVPVRVLVALKKQLGRLRKTCNELAELHEAADFGGIAERVERLYTATDAAVREANESQVEPRVLAAPLVDYLRGEGAPRG